MSLFPLLRRNIKWRFCNAFTIVITVLQPLLWLVLYGLAAGRIMGRAGISDYTAFLLPGLAMLVSFSASSSSGIMNYMMRADGSFYRILISPVSRSAIVLGQLLEAVLCTFFEVGILAIAGLLLSVRPAFHAGGFFLVLLLLFLMSFFAAGLSYGFSLLLPDAAVYEFVMNAAVLPVVFLSSALFPAEDAAGIPGFFIRLNPFTRVIDVLRSLMLSGTAEPSALLSVLVLFAVLCGAAFLWAVSRLKKMAGP